MHIEGVLRPLGGPMFRSSLYSLSVLIILTVFGFGCSGNGSKTAESPDDVGGGSGSGGAAGEVGSGHSGGSGGTAGLDSNELGGAGGADEGRGPGGTDGPDYGDYPTYEGLELPADVGAVAGRIINAEGEPIAGLPILCCSLQICLTGATDGDGVYFITDIDADDSYKMQVTDRNGTYTSLIYYQAIVGGELSLLDGDLVLPNIRSDLVAWAAESGGSVTLANGALTLIANPEELEYPLGFDEEIQADRIEGLQLPPYPSTPWGEAVESVFGFVFNPVHIHSSGALSFEVRDDGVGPNGSVWQVWSLEPDMGILEEVGTATVNADGVLVSDENTQLHHVTTIIFAPMANE